MTPGSHPLLGCCGGHEVTSSTRPVPKEAAQSGPPGRAARPEPLPALLGALCLSIDCEGDPDLSGSLQKRPETGPRGGRELRKLGEERSLQGRSPGSRSRGGRGGKVRGAGSGVRTHPIVPRPKGQNKGRCAASAPSHLHLAKPEHGAQGAAPAPGRPSSAREEGGPASPMSG